MNPPKVSVLLTVYNRASYLEQTIDSILRSNWSDFELIIVDDNSSDGSAEIIKEYAGRDNRIRATFNSANKGQFQNRNYAAGLANGEYIKYQDSDDIIYPHGLEIMVRSMIENPSASLGLMYNAYDESEPLPVVMSSEQVIRTHFFQKGLLYIGPSGSIFKKSDFLSVNGFGDYGVASDYALNLRLAIENPVVLFQRDLIWWRRHDDQEFEKHYKAYIKENNRIVHDMIAEKKFPLSGPEKKLLMINHNKNLARKAILLFAKLRFREASYIQKAAKLRPVSYFHAMLPSSIRKRLAGVN